MSKSVLAYFCNPHIDMNPIPMKNLKMADQWVDKINTPYSQQIKADF